MAEVTSTAAPPWAIKVWSDDNSIYAEVPSINSPCVISAPFTEGGLSKVLSVLGAKHRSEAAGIAYERPTYVAKTLQKEGLTQHDLDLARAALKEAGLIK